MLPDLFRKLKPLYGTAIDLLWIEYQTADVERKREIEEYLTLLGVKKLGLAVGDEKLVLDAPPAALIGDGEFTIGMVSYPSIPPYPFRVKRNELLRHIFILGPTGTGKSTLLLGLLVQIQAARIPFMVFDFKRNYRCLLRATGNESLAVFTVGRNTAPLSINALTPPPGVEYEEWAEALSDIISTSYLLLQGARNVMKEALLQAHAQHGRTATLVHAYELLARELDATKSGSRRYGWLESSTRSLEELTKGNFGRALNATSGTPVADLLTHPVVFELQGFGDDQKRFFCLLWLEIILLLRKNSSAPREQLQHVLIFDEGHNVFPRERPGEVSVPARLAREVREFGEAIIAATQQADVSESLIANSGFKLILRCDYPKDVTFASQLLQIEPRWLPKLPIGTGIARLPVRFYSPILFTFGVQAIKNHTITDDEVRTQWQRMQPAASDVAGTQSTAAAVSEREEALLRDVAMIPISPITQRYKRLGWHVDAGNRAKDGIIKRGLARFDAVSTPRGQVKILTLTTEGVTALVARGVVAQRARSGGAEHEFWKHELRQVLERHGWSVNEEFALGGGKTADLRAERDHHVLFVEVETGRSDIAANVAKYPPSAALVMFFTSADVAAQYRPLIALDRPATRCITPADMDQLT
ncbi:MAG: ATP-binding protein [Acidobacteria bacterium]|nr:ATP-binding protein [Acidobacteriota bacterium]MBV9475064.1 ATP-binding protein [Acidobacteriota bacterium]